MMNKTPNRLHPASIFVLFVKTLRELALPLIIALLVGRGGSYIPWVNNYVILAVGLGITLLFGILRWLTFTYTVDGGELRIKQGVLIRKKRYIRQERIQSINISQGIIQRLFGLVQVRIETAGGGREPEVQLSAITKIEADQLKSHLLSKTDVKAEEARSEEEDEKRFETVWKLSSKDLLITALTSSGIGLAFPVVGAISSQINQFIPDNFFMNTFGVVMTSSVVMVISIIVSIIFIAWILSTIATMLKYGGFSIRKIGDQLEISRGVLEKRQLTLSERRITAIRIVDTPLRQPFGYVSLYVESAGGGTKDEQLSTILLPLLRRKNIPLFLAQILPQFAIDMPIKSVPRRAMLPYILRCIVPTGVAILPIAFFFPYGYFALLILPIAFYVGYLQHRDAGYGWNERFAWLRSRTFNRSTTLIPCRRIQDMERGQSFFQKKRHLSNIKISILSSIASKAFQVKGLDDQESNNFQEFFSMYTFLKSGKR
jgi:putative membrane protein